MPGFEIFGNEERQAIIDLFDQNGGILFRHGFDGMRKGIYKVIEFENAFAKYLNARYALGVSSGTAAIKVGLKALGVGNGDEVITQAFTFIATVEAICDCGAVPILVNVDKTLNMNPADLQKKISKKTKAIMPVNMLGVSADYDPIMKIARQAGIPVLEDNCESMGAKYGERYLGTIGTAGTFSLDFGKVITTGEGGMVVTDDESVYKLAREYHDHGHENNPTLPRNLDTRRIFGFNYRMTELQGAVGIEQLKKLDFIRSANKRNHQFLMKGLKEIGKFEFRTIPSKCEDLCDTIMFYLPSQAHAQSFVKKMTENGLGTKNVPDAIDWHFAGTWHHIFRHYGMTKEMLERECLPSSELLSRCVALPIMVKYDEKKITEIIEKLKKISDAVL
jgi:8-amino-3,8-dideoxy-alpha-D-manno-octulosonate transaminase